MARNRRQTPETWLHHMRRAGFHTLTELAEAAGIEVPTLTRIVHRETQQPREKTMLRIANTLDVSPRVVYELIDQPQPGDTMYEPTPEALYLTEHERKAIDQLIKAMTRERRPEAYQWNAKPHYVLPRPVGEMDPAEWDLAAHDVPSEGKATDDLFNNLGEENQEDTP